MLSIGKEVVMISYMDNRCKQIGKPPPVWPFARPGARGVALTCGAGR